MCRVPNALEQAWCAARPVYALFEATARLGVNFADHRHAMHADDWTALLDFTDQQLLGRPVFRRFDQFPRGAGPPGHRAHAGCARASSRRRISGCEAPARP